MKPENRLIKAKMEGIHLFEDDKPSGVAVSTQRLRKTVCS